MARVYHTKKARRDHGTCISCGNQIKQGQGFYYWQFYRAPKQVKCEACGPPTEIERESNPRRRMLLELADRVESACGDARSDWDMEHLSSEVEDIASEVEGVAEEYEESAESITEHFQDSPLAEEWQDKAEAIREAAEQLRSAASEPDEKNQEEIDGICDAVEQQAEEIRSAV